MRCSNKACHSTSHTKVSAHVSSSLRAPCQHLILGFRARDPTSRLGVLALAPHINPTGFPAKTDVTLLHLRGFGHPSSMTWVPVHPSGLTRVVQYAYVKVTRVSKHIQIQLQQTPCYLLEAVLKALNQNRSVALPYSRRLQDSKMSMHTCTKINKIFEE